MNNTKAREVITKFPNSVLATIDENGFPQMRIMYTVRVADDWKVYYLTAKMCKKCAQIEKTPNVGIEWTNPETWECVDYKGLARLTNDGELSRSLWNDEFKAYFSGPDDPNLVIIEVSPQSVLYNCEMGQCVEQLI